MKTSITQQNTQLNSKKYFRFIIFLIITVMGIQLNYRHELYNFIHSNFLIFSIDLFIFIFMIGFYLIIAFMILYILQFKNNSLYIKYFIKNNQYLPIPFYIWLAWISIKTLVFLNSLI